MPKKTPTKTAKPKAVKKSVPKPQPTTDQLLTEWNRVRKLPTRKSSYDNPEPGVYENLDFDLYTRMNAVNASSLKNALHSMFHYRYAPSLDPNLSQLVFGSLLHELKLEPDEVDKHYIVIPEKEFLKLMPNDPRTDAPYKSPKATKVWKELCAAFLAQHPGKRLVSQDWINQANEMIRSINANPRAKKLFKQGQAELTIVWQDPETNLMCKARIDWLPFKTSQPITDIKSCQKTSKFNNNIGDFSYQIQAAFYIEGVKQVLKEDRNFAFVAVEKQSPFDCVTACLDPHSLAVGEQQRKFLMNQIVKCVEKRRWPRPKNPANFSLPNYYDPNATAANHGVDKIVHNI